MFTILAGMFAVLVLVYLVGGSLQISREDKEEGAARPAYYDPEDGFK